MFLEVRYRRWKVLQRRGSAQTWGERRKDAGQWTCSAPPPRVSVNISPVLRCDNRMH